MAITSLTKTQRGENEYLFRAASDLTSPVYYWWVNGALVSAGNLPFLNLNASAGELSVVDVFDSALSVPEDVYPARALLEWENNAARYRILRLIDAAWVVQQEVPAGRLGSMRYVSGVLDDDAEHRFRVTPIGEDGNEGLSREFRVLMVRRPDSVAATFTYDAEDGELEATS